MIRRSPATAPTVDAAPARLTGRVAAFRIVFEHLAGLTTADGARAAAAAIAAEVDDEAAAGVPALATEILDLFDEAIAYGMPSAATAVWLEWAVQLPCHLARGVPAAGPDGLLVADDAVTASHLAARLGGIPVFRARVTWDGAWTPHPDWPGPGGVTAAAHAAPPPAYRNGVRLPDTAPDPDLLREAALRLRGHAAGEDTGRLDPELGGRLAELLDQAADHADLAVDRCASGLTAQLAAVAHEVLSPDDDDRESGSSEGERL